jgi:hypothetical protein
MTRFEMMDKIQALRTKTIKLSGDVCDMLPGANKSQKWSIEREVDLNILAFIMQTFCGNLDEILNRLGD